MTPQMTLLCCGSRVGQAAAAWTRSYTNTGRSYSTSLTVARKVRAVNKCVVMAKSLDVEACSIACAWAGWRCAAACKARSMCVFMSACVCVHTGDSDIRIKLRRNPYSWSQAATMIYVESPASVGFSYSTMVCLHAYSCRQRTDTVASRS